MDNHGRDNPSQSRTNKYVPDLEAQDTRVRGEPATLAVNNGPVLVQTVSHVSNHDMASGGAEALADDDIYDQLPVYRKHIITGVMSVCGFLAPISSTTVLSAVPEVAATFNTSGSIINLTNAMYMIGMGISPCFWGPIGQVYGRRWPSVFSAALFTAFSVATALAPNLASFFVFRVLTAFQGTAFLILGSSVIGDIFHPVERGTALGWFLSGTLIGPALGPFIGGITVTYRSWRYLFWIQTALGGWATVLVLFLLPETIHHKRSEELKELRPRQKAMKMWQWANPYRPIRLFRYPNLLLVGIASSSLVWNMYSLLVPIRYIINPRFHLTSPLQSGLFFIAPGCGYLFGTLFGGRWADYYTKKYIKKKGIRVPEDRLRSCLIALGIVLPGCMLIYGWCLETKKGGIPVPVIMMFLQGIAQLFCFPSLNTYCLDVMQERRAEVVAGNYLMRYLFAAAASAVVLPAVEKIGVGWFSTISALFLIAAAGCVSATIHFGKGWREALDAKKDARLAANSQPQEEK